MTRFPLKFIRWQMERTREQEGVRADDDEVEEVEATWRALRFVYWFIKACEWKAFNWISGLNSN